jgi:hypothetical protein
MTPKKQRRVAATAAVVVVGMSGCSASMPMTAPAVTVRRADPQPYVPPATRGPLHSGATVGLFATMAEDDVRAAALDFLQSWLTEDVDRLMELISEDFTVGATGGRSINRRVLREAWQRQFLRLDFTQFSLEEVVDENQIEVISFDEQTTRRSPRHRGLRSGDLLVRLPMLVTRRNRRRYFEDVLELWFRRQRGRWRIVAMGN